MIPETETTLSVFISNSENETKNHWGFYQTPAIVRIKANDKVLEVVSSLEWSDTNSLTYEEVIDWMVKNNLID